MTETQPSERTVRWGILGTANIARVAFLPALREAGRGMVFAVAGRDAERTRSYAAANGIERAYQGYERLIADPEIDAVYNPLPNNLHAHWSAEALRAGKVVLCEKPLCVSLVETRALLGVVAETGGLLWEAFVFPFHRQMDRLHEVLASGDIGEAREVVSEFHFELRNRQDIRLSPELGGGALNDVGCYPIHFAGLAFEAIPSEAIALARWAPEGVDEEMQGVIGYSGERRLDFTCGMARAGTTFTRVLGTAGEVRITNPFHPRSGDIFEVRPAGSEPIAEPAATTDFSFTPALQHIHAVLRGETSPMHLAVDEAEGTALALELARQSARQGRTMRTTDLEPANAAT